MTPQPLGSRYLLEEPLGQGGMGVVWRGRDRETGAPCAIKVLRPEFAADPAAVTRFVRERTALIRFRHPNVVTLREMIVEGDVMALVMDLVTGGDLDAYRRDSGGTLPPGDALAVTAQICDALAAAHAAGIVHRDLKPANVLLDAGQVKLADFGIARIVDESRATTTGTIIGTIGYMAPEVIRGEEPGPACDVYAAGITLYALLTGAPPFTGQAATVMHGHLSVEPSRPAGVPDRLWTLMSACLSKDPAARPPAAFLARALRAPALLREPMLQGRPPTGAHAVPSLVSDAALSGPTHARQPDPRHFNATHPGLAYAPHPGQATASAMLPNTFPPVEDGAFAEAPPFPDGAGPGAAGPGSGGFAAPPPGAGWPADRGNPRRPAPRVLLAAAAAVVLVAGGVTATYLVMSGPAGGKAAAAPSAVRLGATSIASALAKSASAVPTRRPSGRPTATTSSAPTPVTATSAAAPSTTQASTHAAPTSAAPPGNPEPTGPNLVADGDFTGSSLSAWDDYVTNTAVTGTAGPSGGYAAQMTGNPTAGVAQYVTDLKAGTTYQLTGWVISDTGGGTYIGSKGYDSTGGVSRASGSTSWSELTMTFKAVGAKTEIFCWQAVAGTGYCTDVSLRALN